MTWQYADDHLAVRRRNRRPRGAPMTAPPRRAGTWQARSSRGRSAGSWRPGRERIAVARAAVGVGRRFGPSGRLRDSGRGWLRRSDVRARRLPGAGHPCSWTCRSNSVVAQWQSALVSPGPDRSYALCGSAVQLMADDQALEWAMSTRLEGGTAPVTGATSNIGRAVVEEFAAEGAHVVVPGRGAGRGKEVVEDIRARGCRADSVQADPDGTAGASRASARAAMPVLGGRIDVLVDNPGARQGAFPGIRGRKPAVVVGRRCRSVSGAAACGRQLSGRGFEEQASPWTCAWMRPSATGGNCGDQ